MRGILILTVLVLCGASLAGCNTIDGMGRDLESAGKTMQRK